MIKIKELRVGQKIKNPSEIERTVLEVLQNVVALDSIGHPGCFGAWFTEHELKDCEVVVVPWDPKQLNINDSYAFLSAAGTVEGDKWNNDNIDNFRARSGNIYPTREAAADAYNKIMNL